MCDTLLLRNNLKNLREAVQTSFKLFQINLRKLKSIGADPTLKIYGFLMFLHNFWWGRGDDVAEKIAFLH